MRYFNRDSRDYHFEETMEAGIVLTGSDAKSLRTQGASFNGAKIDLIANRPVLINLTIEPYKYAQNQQIDKTATRPLLLSQKQIAKLISYRRQKYMIVPVVIYTRGQWIKVEIGIGRKIRKYEKRAKIREKEEKTNKVEF